MLNLSLRTYNGTPIFSIEDDSQPTHFSYVRDGEDIDVSFPEFSFAFINPKKGMPKIPGMRVYFSPFIRSSEYVVANDPMMMPKSVPNLITVGSESFVTSDFSARTKDDLIKKVRACFAVPGYLYDGLTEFLGGDRAQYNVNDLFSFLNQKWTTPNEFNEIDAQMFLKDINDVLD